MPTNKDSLKGFVDFNNTSQHAADSVMNKYFVGFPYSLPSQNEEYVSGIEDITDWVRNGYSSLYSRDGMPGYSFYTDSSGKVYRVSDAENINTSGMSPLSYSEMRKMLPKREYIGGKDYRFRTAQRIPGFLSKIRERAEAYGIDPNLVLNRILHEGWIDQQVINYNGLDASQQGSYWDGLWDAPVSGYGSFGLDYAGNNLMNGIYELKDPDASWREAEFTDYEGGNSFRVGTSLEADNLSSAIEILAAELAYRQGEVAKRYGKKGSDLNVWTNAAFNMGLNNDDFKNEDWVRNQYTYPDYYGQIETQKKLGGIIERFGADKLQQYFASGGSIHIKPSHRGRLTELKERTGKTEAELYNDGNPAHKKMVVFARNSRKWKHADGGLLADAPADMEYANKWDRISNARYTMANNALLRSGSSKMDADRLARFLAAQSALEAGWVDESKGNNYAGYMSNGKRMSFDSADAFWDYHLKNLDERWPAWRDAQTIDDYYNTVNSTALGLTTKEAFNEYNRKHRDAPAYIYAPDWENENYLGKLQSVYNKYISKYVKPMFDAGGFIQKHGRDKILSVIEKMKQSK